MYQGRKITYLDYQLHRVGLKVIYERKRKVIFTHTKSLNRSNEMFRLLYALKSYIYIQFFRDLYDLTKQVCILLMMP